MSPLASAQAERAAGLPLILQLGCLLQQPNEDPPELLEQLFELAYFIVGPDADFRFVVAADHAGGNHR